MAVNEADILNQLNLGVSIDPITDAVLIALESVNEDAIKLARELIKSQSKSQSGTSAQSIIAMPISKNGSSFSFTIEGDIALLFIDAGVNGLQQSFSSPYSFKTASPNGAMAEAIREWIPSAGVQLPSDNPYIKTYEQLSWAIASGVKKKGLKPKPFIEESFGEDFAIQLEFALSVAMGEAVSIKFKTIADKINTQQ
jgi:hypothetical protein